MLPKTLILLALMVLPLLAAEDEPHSEGDRILWTVRWNHDGSRFAVGGEHALWVYDAESLERRSLLAGSRAAGEDGADTLYMAVTHVAWHPSRDLLAVSSQGQNVTGIYGLEDGTRLRLPTLQDNDSRGVSWSPNADRLAVTSTGDGHLRIYDAEGALLHDVPRFEDARGLTGVAWRPTGDRIVTIGSRITLHDADGSPIKQWMHRPEARERGQLLLSVAWHPSGAFFVVGDYGTEVDDPVLQFWSADGDLIRSIALEGDTQVRNVSWAPDGGRFAAASSTLSIWTEEGELESRGEAPDLLWGVAWHPDNDTILTSDLVGRITLWDSSAKPIRDVREHRSGDR